MKHGEGFGLPSVSPGCIQVEVSPSRLFETASTNILYALAQSCIQKPDQLRLTGCVWKAVGAL